MNAIISDELPPCIQSQIADAPESEQSGVIKEFREAQRAAVLRALDWIVANEKNKRRSGVNSFFNSAIEELRDELTNEKETK